MRDDIRGGERCPSDVEDYLLRIGGRTPFGEPMWRLAVASSVIWKVAGGKVWNEHLSVAERGGFNFDEGRPHDDRPLREEFGKLVEQRRFPHLDGWILQKWFPPTAYSKTQWFASENCLPDGTPKLGPFPQYGDYEMVGGPTRKIPSRQELYEFISAYYRGLESRSGSVQSRIQEAVNAAEYAQRREDEQTRALVDNFMRDKCSYIWSSSLEAGRLREQTARKCGIREHVGN